MSEHLYRTRSVKFGNSTLIAFLKAHGAEVCYERITLLDVPVAALRKALEELAAAGLTEEDIAIIKKDVEESDEDEAVTYGL